ncbi:transmembrane amino acid transporter protein-domain-containing protein [Dichotomocladium elegans]|nr:transmembrane amino acid transporter protein-domain-containing protein [Dichotomocladium elegans]
MQSASNQRPGFIPDKRIATLVQQHLIIESPSHDNDDVEGPDHDRQPRSPDGDEVIPIPYHLPGTSVTHDIYNHANSLRTASVMYRSKSSGPSDFVYENLDKPGGFRRHFYINRQQQQQQQPTRAGNLQNEELALFRTPSTSSCDSCTALESVALSSTIRSMRGVQTRHFLEYLAITSVIDRFAGEDLSDSEGEDEEIQPLLSVYRKPQKKAPQSSEADGKHKANLLKSGFLLFKAFISSGILFLPKAFSNGGLAFSMSILYFMGFVSLYCFLLLLKCKEQIAGSYGDIGGALYGPSMRHAVLFSIAISQLGFNCGGTIFIVENVVQAVRSLTSHAIDLEETRVLMLIALSLMPLVLIRNISKLSPAALFADVLIVTGLFIILACDIYQIFFSGGDTGVHAGPNMEWWFNPNMYPVFVGTAVYSFEGIGLIIPIRDAMEKPEKFPMVLTIVMVIVATILCAVGAMGYVAFGSDVKTVALLNLPEGPLASVVQLGYALAVHLTNPLCLFPTIRIIEHGIFGERTGKHSTSIKWQKNAVRFGVVIVGALIAWGGANDLDKFISLIGSICCCPLSLIFPPLFHLQLSTTKGFCKIIDQILIVFGTGVMFFTLWNTAHQWGAT